MTRRLLPLLLTLTACAPAPTLTSTERAQADAALLSGYWGRGEPGAVCSHELLGRDGDALYVWAVCENYHREGADWKATSGMSGPAVVRLGAAAASVQYPGDGSRYAPDIRRLFPERLHSRILRHDPDLIRRVQAQNRARVAAD